MRTRAAAHQRGAIAVRRHRIRRQFQQINDPTALERCMRSNATPHAPIITAGDMPNPCSGDLSTAQPNSGVPWRIKAGADLIGARCCDALAFGDCGPVQAMCWPPFAAIVAPVMNPASSLARNATHFAISSAVPSRPTGICAVMLSRTFSGMAATISVLI